jgi:hypothetical protein
MDASHFTARHAQQLIEADSIDVQHIPQVEQLQGVTQTAAHSRDLAVCAQMICPGFSTCQHQPETKHTNMGQHGTPR